MADEPTAAPTEDTDAHTQLGAHEHGTGDGHAVSAKGHEVAPVESADQQSEAIDWDSLEATIEKAYSADPKVAADRLKKHRAISGIAGNLAERRYAELEHQRTTQQQAEARNRAAEELKAMARDRPLEFADKFLNESDAADARLRVTNVERNAAKNIIEQIGAAYHGLPEWAELTDEEKGKLAKAVEGAPDTEVLPRFNRTALDIVAERRSTKRTTEALAKEKEAWRKEWEAERLSRERGPDLRSPSSVARKRVSWSAMSDKDFSEYWQKRYG